MARKSMKKSSAEKNARRRLKAKSKKASSTGKAVTHPLRLEIMDQLQKKPMSPKELSEVLKEGLSQTSYHVKVLRHYKCITLVRTEPRRGAVEHYYELSRKGKAVIKLFLK